MHPDVLKMLSYHNDPVLTLLGFYVRCNQPGRGGTPATAWLIDNKTLLPLICREQPCRMPPLQCGREIICG